MDPATAMMLGQIGGSVVGGLFGRSAAKKDRAANAAANRMRMMPYLDARSNILDLYSRGQNALNDQLNTGFYQGQTRAGLDPSQLDAIRMMQNTGTTAGADASNFMNVGRGFANNYQDLFNRASQDMLGNAINYASTNTEPLLAAAMRDPFRQLTEQTLPTIDRNAMATGNTNSSRAGVAEALANRAFADRSADVGANIQNSLIDRSMRAQQGQLANMTAANKNLAGLYNMGFDQSGNAASMLNRAGGMLQLDEQARLDDDRARFEGNRDFDMNTLMNYNAGILGRTPTTTGNIQNNMANPMMGALSGAIGGAGMGGQMGSYFGNMFAPQPAATPLTYGQAGTRMSYLNPYMDNLGYGVG